MKKMFAIALIAGSAAFAGEGTAVAAKTEVAKADAGVVEAAKVEAKADVKAEAKVEAGGAKKEAVKPAAKK